MYSSLPPFVRELDDLLLLATDASAKLATLAIQHRHRPKLHCGIVPSSRCGERCKSGDAVDERFLSENCRSKQISCLMTVGLARSSTSIGVVNSVALLSSHASWPRRLPHTPRLRLQSARADLPRLNTYIRLVRLFFFFLYLGFSQEHWTIYAMSSIAKTLRPLARAATASSRRSLRPAVTRATPQYAMSPALSWYK